MTDGEVVGKVVLPFLVFCFGVMFLTIYIVSRDTPEDAARKAERQAHIEEIKSFAPACWLSSGHLQSWDCVSAVADKKLVEQMGALRERLDLIEAKLK